MEAYASGRLVVTWQHASCFLTESVKVEYDKLGRASCKDTGERFVKGELRVVFSSIKNSVFYRAEPAVALLRKIVTETSSPWQIDSMIGFEALTPEHAGQLKLLFSGKSIPAGSCWLAEGAAKKTPAKKKRKRDMREETRSDDGNSDAEESPLVDASTLVWGLVPGSPWWPAQRTEAETAEQKAAARKRHSFVVFFGAEPRTWAWVKDENLKSFRDNLSLCHSSPKHDVRHYKNAVSQALRSSGLSAPADVKQEDDKQEDDKQEDVKQEDDMEVEETPAQRTSAALAAGTQPQQPSAQSSGLSEYELFRLENVRRNQEELRRLGIADAVSEAKISSGVKASSRGIKPQTKRAKKTLPVEPPRRSSRVKGETAQQLYVTSERAGKVSVAGLPSAMLKISEEAAQAGEEDDKSRHRLPDEELSLESTCCTEESGAEFLSSLVKLSAAAQQEKDTAQTLSADTLAYAERMSRLRISEAGVSKVTHSRIYSIAAHPSTTNIVVAAGDKEGNIGLWNMDDSTGENDGVVGYTPHTATVNQLQFHPARPSKLYTTSYDGTVRCLDVEKGCFDFVYGVQSSRDSWLQCSTLGAGNAAEVLYLGDSDGDASAIDLRTQKPIWEVELHDKKVQTIHGNPVHTNYLCSASLDRCCKIWDIRKMGSKRRPAPVATLLDHRSVNNAEFSPDGGCLLSAGQANCIRLYYDAHQLSGVVEDSGASRSIHHDNQTGRYLAVFHAKWDPKTTNSFVIGSMAKPRQVEVFSTARAESGKKAQCTRIASLQGDELSSVQSRNCFHPRLDAVICGNASGRVHVFR